MYTSKGEVCAYGRLKPLRYKMNKLYIFLFFVATSLLRREIHVVSVSSSCKSVSGPIYGLWSLPEVVSSSPRQVGEISVGFIRRSLYFNSNGCRISHA